MGNQSSEMKDKYRGEPEVTLDTRFDERFQPPKLHDHHVNGPSKVCHVVGITYLLKIVRKKVVTGHWE